MKKKMITLLTATTLVLGALTGCGSDSATDTQTTAKADTIEITNVSYDPTRESFMQPIMNCLQITGKKRPDRQFP